MPARSLCLLVTVLAAGGLAACADNMPEGATPAPGAAVVTPPAVVTSPAVVTVPPAAAPTVISPGTIVTAPSAAATTTVVVPGSGSSTVEVVPSRLDATQISALLANNTVAGVAANGQPYYALFQRDGRLRIREGTFSDSGTWSVTPDGRLCSTLTVTNVGVPECYVLRRDGTAVDFDRPNGGKVGTFSVLPGNPQSL